MDHQTAKDTAATIIGHIGLELQNLELPILIIEVIDFFQPLLVHLIFLFLMNHLSHLEITHARGYTPLFKEVQTQ